MEKELKANQLNFEVRERAWNVGPEFPQLISLMQPTRNALGCMRKISTTSLLFILGAFFCFVVFVVEVVEASLQVHGVMGLQVWITSLAHCCFSALKTRHVLTSCEELDLGNAAIVRPSLLSLIVALFSL